MENTKFGDIQQNANETDNKNSNYEMVEREEIEETPFTMITIEGKSFGTMGIHRLTEYGTKKEIRKELKEFSWNRLVQVLMLLEEQNVVKELINQKDK